MNQTTTGIVVALAVAVVAIFFLFPGLSPFGSAPATTALQTATDTTSTNPLTASSTPPSMTTSDGLQITDEVVGTGPAYAPGDSIQVSYVGALTDGTVFDSTAAHGGAPLALVVAADGSLHTPDGGSLIQGWSEGMAGMKQGGKRKLVIPSALGYGSQAVGNIIPANSTLVFEVELVSVTSK